MTSQEHNNEAKTISFSFSASQVSWKFCLCLIKYQLTCYETCNFKVAVEAIHQIKRIRK